MARKAHRIILRVCLYLLCGAGLVLLAKTCGSNPQEGTILDGQEAVSAMADSGESVARAYQVSEVPNPKNSSAWNWVSNPDGILEDETVAEINGMLNELEDSLSIEVAVVALNSIGEEVPREFAYELFNFWGIGKAGLDNGLLVLLVLDQREVVFETGYGLEEILPDVTCFRIQQQFMVPWFSADHFNTGMLEGVRGIVQKLYGSDYAEEEIQSSGSFRWSDMDAGTWIVLLIFSLIIGGPNVFMILWIGKYYRLKENTAEAALDAIMKGSFISGKNWMLLFFWPVWPSFFFCFLWYWLWRRWHLIRQSRVCPTCGKSTLYRLPGKEEVLRLSDAQNLENKLHSAVHRIYRCRHCAGELEFHRTLASSYCKCEKCDTCAQKRVGAWQTVKSATYSSEGLQKADYRCLACGEKMIVKRKIERKSHGSSGSSGGGHSSSSGGHFGGGHSGGGGASSRF